MTKEDSTDKTKTSFWVARQLDLAVISAIVGLLCVLLFLWHGFGAWSMGLGTFVGLPLLGVAVVLYITAVAADLKRRGAL